MTDKPKLTPAACRAGRALLGWTIDDLAAASDLTRDSISRFERGAFGMKPDTQERVVTAFASAGVEVFAAPRDGARRKA